LNLLAEKNKIAAGPMMERLEKIFNQAYEDAAKQIANMSLNAQSEFSITGDKTQKMSADERRAWNNRLKEAKANTTPADSYDVKQEASSYLNKQSLSALEAGQKLVEGKTDAESKWIKELLDKEIASKKPSLPKEEPKP
jgi:hypothetical protein